MTMKQSTSAAIRTLADLVNRMGCPPLDRIRFHPFPGTATMQDVTWLEEKEDILCELMYGVLLEKTTGFRESALAASIGALVDNFVLHNNTGIVTDAAGAFELLPNLVRMPDVAYTSWDRLPGRCYPTEPIPSIAPNLAVEVLSRNNTPGEMSVKRQDYFTAGVQVVWEVDLDTRTVQVFESPTNTTILGESDTLDGGMALPGFSLPVKKVFRILDRHG